MTQSHSSGHFPESIPLPQSIEEARAERKQHLFRSMKWGMSIRTFIIIFEFIGAWVFASAALLMDGLSSLVDVGCSLLLLFFIKLAERPPDANHPFGHGRYEPLAGLQLGLFLTAIGSVMFFQQIWQLTTVPVTGQLDPRAWLIPLVAVVLLECCHAITMRAAKKHHSAALVADAAHYRVDSLTSMCAVIALLFAAYFPDWSVVIDRMGALTIAVLMIVLGINAGRGNVHQLLDTVPDRQFFDRVRKATQNVKGVLGVEKTRIQLYGPDAHVDIDVEVDPLLSVEKAHEISQQVRVSIQKEWPAVRDVMVHIEPYYEGDH